MPLSFKPGNALSCVVNSHRHRWNGVICENAPSWNCGADLHFREGYCDRGDPRCYHLHLFDEASPYLLIDERGGGWIFEVQPRALDDQILLLCGREFDEPRGLPEARIPVPWVFGCYRVKSVERTQQWHRTVYKIVPYADGWTRLLPLRIARPYYRSAGGPYVNQIERLSVDRVFQEAEQQLATLEAPEHEATRRRLRHALDQLPRWFEAARARAVEHGQREQPDFLGVSAASDYRPLKDLNRFYKFESEAARVAEGSPAASRALARTAMVPSTAPAAPPTPAVAPAPAATAAAPAALLGPIVEEPMRAAIAERYDEDTLHAILVGSITKPLLILRGEPGVGKSTLALQLVADAKGERTLVVPVASSWRGREDLLGHINPISNEFEPTRFTRFLIEAARAWDKQDRRLRLVVFEEFNLSQPEYWLSDLLVRWEYLPDKRAERTIELGGKAVRGLPDADPAGVYLAPSVRFVATINSDHTTRPLSPRILDRGALVELTMDPAEAVRQAGLKLSEEQVEAVSSLHFLTRSKGAAFSFRTARSLQACDARLAELHLEIWDVIDLVLLQEVLSKVRLLAGDPGDLRLVAALMEWSSGAGIKCSRCANAIAEWNERLKEGADVTQA